MNIAPLLSFQGGITVPAYAAALATLALAKAHWNEWAKERINVNAIALRLHRHGKCEERSVKIRVRNKAILDCFGAGRGGRHRGGCVSRAAAIWTYLNGAVLPGPALAGPVIWF